jgi:hypothetical protein
MRKAGRRALTLGLLATGIGLVLVTSAQATTYRNTSRITIPDGNAPAAPYPSTITTPALTGTITSITVNLRSLIFPNADDVGIVVQAPDGRALALLNGGPGPTNANILFTDLGPFAPQAGTLTGTHSYRPTDYYAGDDFPAGGPNHLQYSHPGPDGGGTATLASTFNGINPTGTWKLWVADFDSGPHTGAIAGGWFLNIIGTQIDNNFTLGTPIRAKKGVRATIPATFPNPGKAVIDDIPLGRVKGRAVEARKNGKRHGLVAARAISVQPGTSSLPVVPNARARKILAKRRRVAVHLYVGYTPEKGATTVQNRTLVLFRKR